MTGVSLIIPTYNRSAMLRTVLESLLKMDIPEHVEWEILVIDNNCTDDTAAVVAAAADRLPVRSVREEQQGLCFARNRAIQEARFEHLIYLDDDIVVASTWVRGYLQALESLNADAVVGPVNPVYPREMPHYATSAVLRLISSTYSQKGAAMILLPRETSHEISGCNFAVQKQVAIELGGFDPRLDRVGSGLLSGGDWEFGWRLAGSRKRVVYHPDCAIQHIIAPGKLTRSYLRRRAFGDAVSGTAIAAKHGESVLVRRRVRMVARMLRFVIGGMVYRMSGRPGLAMECEIQAYGCAGTVFGPLLLRVNRDKPSASGVNRIRRA